jgi:hypothetical protein
LTQVKEVFVTFPTSSLTQVKEVYMDEDFFKLSLPSTNGGVSQLPPRGAKGGELGVNESSALIWEIAPHETQVNTKRTF